MCAADDVLRKPAQRVGAGVKIGQGRQRNFVLFLRHGLRSLQSNQGRIGGFAQRFIGALLLAKDFRVANDIQDVVLDLEREANCACVRIQPGELIVARVRVRKRP